MIEGRYSSTGVEDYMREERFLNHLNRRECEPVKRRKKNIAGYTL